MTHPSIPPPAVCGGPRLVGIVNITADSFSDGGRYLAARDALAHARRLLADGADVIELGPASSHPDAAHVSSAQERARLTPVLSELVSAGIPVSVDSHLPETQQLALEHGASYLNDIHGFPDPCVYDALAAAECRLIVMHSIQRSGHATRVRTDPAAVLAGIDEFFTARLRVLREAGIPSERLVIDPGLGYFLGSTPEPSLAALGRIRHLRERFGLPVLVSPSRKSFLRTLTGRDLADIGPGTLAAELYAVGQGVDYIRTHDIAALRDALTVVRALTGPDDVGIALSGVEAAWTKG